MLLCIYGDMCKNNMQHPLMRKLCTYCIKFLHDNFTSIGFFSVNGVFVKMS